MKISTLIAMLPLWRQTEGAYCILLIVLILGLYFLFYHFPDQVEVTYSIQKGIHKVLGALSDIVISDVMMPEKVGFGLCVTAQSAVGSHIAKLRQSADAYLANPFNKKELHMQMNHLSERQRLRQKYGGQDNEDISPQNEERETPPEDEFIGKVRTIIEEHLDDFDLDVSKMCRELGISRAPLHKKLKALAGKSTTEYIRFVRLTKAKELLLTTGLNISEVGYETGFRNPHYFTRTFKELFGVSPSEYREKNT